MVDRVYKANIPAVRRALEKLRARFAKLDSKTDWTSLRIDPLLRHAKQLEQQLKQQGSARLKRGVAMFHSDLVYFQENLKGLNRILHAEEEHLKRRATTRTKTRS
jgi:hypothetical protein